MVRRLAGALARHTGQEDKSHHITGTSSRYLYNTSMSSSRYLNNTSCRYLYNTSLPQGGKKHPALVGVYYRWGYLV